MKFISCKFLLNRPKIAPFALIVSASPLPTFLLFSKEKEELFNDILVSVLPQMLQFDLNLEYYFMEQLLAYSKLLLKRVCRRLQIHPLLSYSLCAQVPNDLNLSYKASSGITRCSDGLLISSNVVIVIQSNACLQNFTTQKQT